MKIRIAGTEFSLSQKAFEIYIQGCYRQCSGCHNPETQPYNGGKEVDINEFLMEKGEVLLNFYNLVDNIYITGGDLLCHSKQVAQEFSKQAVNLLPFNDCYYWLFTGCKEENLPKWVWDYYDIIKCGEYQENNLNPKGSFPASKNQKLIFNSKRKHLLMYKFHTTEFKGEKRWSNVGD